MDTHESSIATDLAGDVAGEYVRSISPAPQRVRVAVWDLPLRLAHWSLATAVTTAVITGKLGGEWMELHGKAGLTVIGILAFRITWGFVGGTHARFKSFVRGPGALFDYLRGRWHGLGHNPLGALSVLALLAVLAVQASTGLFSNDDIAFTGPWFAHVNDDAGAWATSLHRRSANWLLWLCGLHLAAIAFYVLIKRHTLLRPMFDGVKEVDASQERANASSRQASIVALLFALAVAGVVVFAATAVWA